MHSLKGEPNVIDIRNIGLIGAVEMSPLPGAPGKRGFNSIIHSFEHGTMLRITGDIIALSPPLIISKPQIDELIDNVRNTIRAVA